MSATRDAIDPNRGLRSLLDRGKTVRKPDLARALVPLTVMSVLVAVEQSTLAETAIGRLLLHIEAEARKSRPERMILKGSLRNE